MIKINKQIVMFNKGSEIKVDVIYRNRKNVTITVKPKNQVAIISPPGINIKTLEKLLKSKSNWILKKLEKYKDIDLNEEIIFEDGTKLYYLGDVYCLNIIKSTKCNSNVYISKNKIIIESNDLSQSNLKDILKKWYKSESEKIVIEKLQKLKNKSEIMNSLAPTCIKVKEQNKRWGSCTSKGNIYINSKISMARPKSIEYILVHEFSHLVHMNHSKEFYKFVGRIMPSYKDEEVWLKNNSYKLKL